MIDDYGVLSQLVATASALIGAATAIGVGWMRRARWLPPEEDLPGSVSRVVALLCAVAIAILYVFRHNILGPTGTALTAAWAVGLAVLSLLCCVYLNTTHSYEKVVIDRREKKTVRVLGGFVLTDEAKRVAKRHGIHSQQQLYENANYRKDLVWTRPSQGLLKVLATMSYLSFQACGSVGLASAGILMSFWVGEVDEGTMSRTEAAWKSNQLVAEAIEAYVDIED